MNVFESDEPTSCYDCFRVLTGRRWFLPALITSLMSFIFVFSVLIPHNIWNLIKKPAAKPVTRVTKKRKNSMRNVKKMRRQITSSKMEAELAELKVFRQTADVKFGTMQFEIDTMQVEIDTLETAKTATTLRVDSLEVESLTLKGEVGLLVKMSAYILASQILLRHLGYQDVVDPASGCPIIAQKCRKALQQPEFQALLSSVFEKDHRDEREICADGLDRMLTKRDEYAHPPATCERDADTIVAILERRKDELSIEETVVLKILKNRKKIAGLERCKFASINIR